MHCLEMVLDDEIGQPYTIRSIGFRRSEIPGSEDYATLYNLEIHAGLTDLNSLVSVYNDNYIPGSRTMLLQADTLVVGAPVGEWYFIDLDIPYEYDNLHNLLLEFETDGLDWEQYLYMWPTDEYRMVRGHPGVPTGYRFKRCNHMILSDNLSEFKVCTFGTIKRMFSLD